MLYQLPQLVGYGYAFPLHNTAAASTDLSRCLCLSLEDLSIKRESGFLPKLQGIFIAGGTLASR